MNLKVKEYADSGDVKSLTYVFLDSLDVDPTFESYREEFEYCRNIPGLWAVYEELTPLTSDRSRWTLDYWTNLKKDLKKNFSIKRFDHMRTVSVALFADKIKRINDENKAASTVAVQQQSASPQRANYSEEQQISDAQKRIEAIKAKEAADAAERARKREEARKAEEERLRKIREDEEKKIKSQQYQQHVPSHSQHTGELPKKANRAWVIPIIIIAIVILAIVIFKN